MTIDELNSNYFSWLCGIVSDSMPKRKSFTRLLRYLHDTEFVSVLPMDANRASDGINLRYRFGDEVNIEQPAIATCLDTRACSVLEMMVALALRCDEHITYNPRNGLKAGRWFWMFIDNLGLIDITDNNYDRDYVEKVVWRFLDRGYTHDGAGGLVYIKDCSFDMRTTEIWYQMMRYLSTLSRGD